MSVLKFTGGSVTYDRNIKTADYEGKKLSFTLAFGADEELTEDQLGQAADLAINLVHEKLGLRKVAPAVSSTVAAVATNAAAKQQPGTGAPSTVPAVAPPTTRKPSKKPPVIDVQLTPEEIAAATARGNITESPEDRKDPAAIEDDEIAQLGPILPGAADANAAAKVEGNDPAAIEDDIFSAEAPAVTDSALTDAITKHNAKIKNPIAIRQLIGKYVTPPKQARDIPAELRAAFIEQLEKL